MALSNPAISQNRWFREWPLDLNLEEVIARGQRSLSFPPALEAEFESDTVAARRRLLIICGMFGICGIWFSMEILIKMAPETAERAVPLQYFLIGLAAVSQCISLTLPKTLWKSQYFELITTLNTLSVGAVAVWATSLSASDVMFTHSAVVIGVLMYPGIAARQRFRWTFVSSTLTLIGYCIFTNFHTPLQQLIVHSNITMLVLGLVLTLMASYGFEFRERRAWLLRKQSLKMQANLAQASERLRELSVRDPLTGLYNRRHFDAALERALELAAADGQSLAMLMVDVDFFKRYNDNHGHPAGDVCLKTVAEALSEVAGAHAGVVGRLGGEEFGILLYGYSLAAALKVGQQVCGAVSAAAIEHRASSVAPHVTVSVGVASMQPVHGASGHGLVQAADRALYLAKEQGRDRALVIHGTDEQALVLDPVVLPASASARASTTHATPLLEQAEVQVRTLSRVLERGFRWLFFPKGMEAIFQEHHLEERRRHLLLAAVVGVLTLNSYLFATQAMFPDVAANVLTSVLMLSMVILVGVGITAVMPMKPWARESLYALSTTVVTVVLVHGLSLSQAFTAFSFAVALFLVPLFACVVARQPFWYALVPTIVTLACMGMFKPGSPLAQLVMEDSIMIVINASIYTLIAAYTLEHAARKEWLLNQIGLRQHEELEATTRHLHLLSVSDPLTGLSNRRQFEADFDRVWLESMAAHQPVGLLIMDLDFFKNYNDRHGHPAGDRCLQRVAKLLAEVAEQAQGMAARLGGEEFAIVLPGRTLTQTMAVGERACEMVRQARIAHGFSQDVPFLTLSAGAASLVAGSSQINGPHELLKSADLALYQAKTSGRNRVGPINVAAQAQEVTAAG